MLVVLVALLGGLSMLPNINTGVEDALKRAPITKQ